MRVDLAVLVGVLAGLFLSMPVFAVRSAASKGDRAPVDGRSPFVAGGFLARWFGWLVTPVESAACALGLGPFFFSVLGLLLGVAAGTLFLTGHVYLAGWAVLLSGGADILDGKLARTLGIDGPKGAFIDSTLDRFSESAVLVGLAVFFAGSGLGQGLVTTTLGGSLLVSYTRARGESVGVLCKQGVMQRPERILLLGLGAVLDPAVSAWWGAEEGALLLPVLAVMAVGTVGTAIHRTVWIALRLNEAGG